MYPAHTHYRLATAPRDYVRCRTLLRAQGQTRPLSFPTVLAERGGQVVGFLATQPRRDAVVAGPLVVAPDVARPGILVLRLGEAYEAVLRRAGVRLYLFHVESSRPGWRSILERLGYAPYHADDRGAFYRRELA